MSSCRCFNNTKKKCLKTSRNCKNAKKERALLFFSLLLLLLFLEGIFWSHFSFVEGIFSCGRVPSCFFNMHRRRRKKVESFYLRSRAGKKMKKKEYYPMYFNRNLICPPHTYTLFYYFLTDLFPSFLPF